MEYMARVELSNFRGQLIKELANLRPSCIHVMSLFIFRNLQDDTGDSAGDSGKPFVLFFCFHSDSKLGLFAFIAQEMPNLDVALIWKPEPVIFRKTKQPP